MTLKTPKTSVNEIILEIKKELRNCDSIEQNIRFAFNFSYKDFSIKPLQNREEIHSLLKILSPFSPKIIVEIGTANGGMLFLLSRIADPEAIIISIDLPGGEFGGEFYPEWKEPIYKSFPILNQKIHLIRGSSHDLETIVKLKKLLGKQRIDFLLIDGDHTYDGVKQDYEMYNELVSETGVIAFHDINDEDTKNVEVSKFWNEIRIRLNGLEIRYNEKGRGFGIGLITKSQDKNLYKYTTILRDLNDLKDNRIQKLFHNPLSILLSLYSERSDLQNSFPEVYDGDYTKLISWASTVVTEENTKERDAKRYLSKFSSWYIQFKGLQESRSSSIDLEKSVNVKNLAIEELEKSVNFKNLAIANLEKSVRSKNLTIANLEKSVNVKNLTIANLEKSVRSKNLTIANLEKSVRSKNLTIANLEKSVNVKNLTIEELEKSIKIKDNYMIEIIQSLKQKDESIFNMDQMIKLKENELRYIRSEISEIHKSIVFNMMKSILQKIDASFPNGTGRGEFRKIVNGSLSMIIRDGFRKYLEAVKFKISKKEFTVLSQINLSEHDVLSLTNTVQKNRKNRLKIIPHNKREIINDEFIISEEDQLI